MTLPTPVQMKALSELIVEHGKITKGKWYTYKGMLQSLERMKGEIASSALGSGAQSALTHASGVASGITVGAGVASVTFVPFGAVLAPWIAAADIARQAGDIFELHDLKEQAAGRGQNSKMTHYTCQCGKCFENIKYVVDKKERNVGRIAVGVFTIGVTVIATKAYSVYKSFQKGRPKEMTSKGLVNSARSGCTVAMAAIFLLAGNWQFLRGGNAGIMRRATAIITSEDGWQVLKDEW